MRALLVAPPGTPAIAEVAAPLRQRGEVLVEVHHAAIDSGDAAVSAGVFHELGYIERATVGLGWDFAGTVTESDPSSEFRPGQRVVGVIDTFDKEVGAVSEYVSVPEDALTHLPDGVSSEEGAVVPVAALTALQALATLGEERGSLLVTGAAGMVGGFAIAIARELGFAVTGLARDHDRAFVESTGAAFVDGLAGSYDAVFDTAQLGAEALAVVADGGRYVGVMPGGEPASVRGVRVTSLVVAADRPQLTYLLGLIASKDMVARIREIVDLDQAPAAVMAPRAERGRTVVSLR